jgi:putative PIN family toxin of toxin-antitoxin system
MFRVVLDTNVILAAYLTKGAAAKIIKKWAENSFELLISEEIVKEYLRG